MVDNNSRTTTIKVTRQVKTYLDKIRKTHYNCTCDDAIRILIKEVIKYQRWKNNTQQTQN